MEFGERILNKIKKLKGAKKSTGPIDNSKQSERSDGINKIPIVYENEWEGGWRRRSIIHEQQPEGGRSIGMYEKILGFDKNGLEGKDVLDLGTGPDGKFAKGLEEAGIKANVVGISPDFIYPEYSKRISESQTKAHYAAALGQALPFADESFDRIFAFHLLEHIRSEEDLIKIMQEVIRTLRKNGKAYIGPTEVDMEGKDYIYEFIINNEEVKRNCLDKRITLSHNEISTELYSPPIYTPSGYRMYNGWGYSIVLDKSDVNPAS